MSSEKKLREYAEGRLAAMTDGADSLARLKAEQTKNAPTEEPTRSRRALGRRLAFGLSAVAAVVVAVVCVFRFVPLAGGGSSDEATMLSGESDISSEGFAENIFDPKGGASGYQMMDGANGAVRMPTVTAINERTAYIEILVEESEIIADEEKGDERYTFTVNRDGVKAEGILSFGEMEAESFPYLCDRETTLAGQTFLYGTEGEILFGKIVTDCECVYLLKCTGGTEEARLALLGEIFSER